MATKKSFSFGTLGSLFSHQEIVSMKETILEGQSALRISTVDAQLQEEANRLGVSLKSKKGYDRVMRSLSGK
jgi:hypothetical protein